MAIMTKRKILYVAMGLALATAATSARAQDNGWYFGISGGQAQIDLNKSAFDSLVLSTFALAGAPVLSATSSLEDSDTSFSLLGGYRFSPYFALEAGYVDFGTFEYRAAGTVNPPGPALSAPASFSSDFELTGFTAGASGSLPIGKSFDLHAKAGFLFADSEVSANASIGTASAGDSGSSSSENFYYGVGAGLHLWERWTFSLDWQQFKDQGDEGEDESDVDRLSLGVTYRL